MNTIELAVHEGVEMAFDPDDIPSLLSSIQRYSILAETYHRNEESKAVIDELTSIIENAVACLILLDA